MAEIKVWLVTGSSVGLGRAVVEHALSQGSNVVATCRKPSDLDDLVAKYPVSQLVVTRLDVGIPSEIAAAFERAITAFGRIDVVYNNAAILDPVGEIEGFPDKLARAQFEINFWGAANVSREAVRVLRDVNSPPGGRILQASSCGAIYPTPGCGYYCASKFALEGLSEGLQSEVHPSWNIKITLLQLGCFSTRIFAPQSLTFTPEHAAYGLGDNTVHLTRESYAPGGSVHATLADANKAAREIYKIAGDNDVGLRVLLGEDSLAMAANKLKELQESLETSKPLSADLQFDNQL